MQAESMEEGEQNWQTAFYAPVDLISPMTMAGALIKLKGITFSYPKDISKITSNTVYPLTSHLLSDRPCSLAVPGQLTVGLLVEQRTPSACVLYSHYTSEPRYKSQY